MKYRADIDGLRALAVVPVVLFHLGTTGFNGGFVGVDIFFVISGYLITGLIAEEIKTGRFTIGRFYERRIRRIFPALFAMLSCVLVAGAVLFLPQDMKSLNASLVATSLFVSNIYLWFSSGYFAKGAEMQPLLHTWSLAVEEQFYIFFPLFLMLAWRWGRHWRGLTWMLLLGSLALSIYAVRYHADAAFYFLPTRAWELLLGSVIAFEAMSLDAASGSSAKKLNIKMLNEVLAWTGIAFILFAVFWYGPATRFPGERALLPCVGAALIIYSGLSGSQTSVARTLSWPPIVFVGLISYSLYLWHWPLIVFAKYRNITALSVAQSMAVLAASILMSVISWRFIERPFRRSSHAPIAAGLAGPSSSLHWPWISNRVVMRGLVVTGVSAMIGLLGNTVYSNDSALKAIYGERIYRYDRQSLKIESPRACRTALTIEVNKTCLLGDVSAAPTVALWGDSYSDALTSSLSIVLKTAQLSAVRFVMHSCPSILHTLRSPDTDANFSHKCRQFNDAAFNALTNSSAIKTVIVTSAYLWYLETTQSQVLLVPMRQFATDDQRRQLILDELADTLKALAASGKQVIVVGAYPMGISASAITRSLNFSNTFPAAVTIARSEYDRKVALVNTRLRQLQSSKIVFIDPASIFCQAPASLDCSFVQHDAPMLSDGSHLSAAAAMDLSQMIVTDIQSAVPSSLEQSVLAKVGHLEVVHH